MGPAGPKNASRPAVGADHPDKLHPATPSYTRSISRPRSFARTRARTQSKRKHDQNRFPGKGLVQRRTHYPKITKQNVCLFARNGFGEKIVKCEKIIRCFCCVLGYGLCVSMTFNVKICIYENI